MVESDFIERYGRLTVAEALELNEKTRESEEACGKHTEKA